MDLRQVLQAELIMAMKNQDRSTMTVLRSVLSAIANAEAVPAPEGPVEAMLGSAEVSRKELTPQQIKMIVIDEVDSRRDSVGYFETAGRHEEAENLKSEAAILERYLYLTN